MESEVQVWDIEGNNVTTPVPLQVCSNHTREQWTEGTYTQEGNTVLCVSCSWGTYLPGYMRLVDGKIVDLRILKGAKTSLVETS